MSLSIRQDNLPLLFFYELETFSMGRQGWEEGMGHRAYTPKQYIFFP